MDTNEKISQLENEIKVLKNEVQAVLIDLRENYLNAENPFNATAAPVTSQQIILDRQVPASEPRPRREAERPAAPGEGRRAEQEEREASDEDEAEPERPVTRKRSRRAETEEMEASGDDGEEPERPVARKKSRRTEPEMMEVSADSGVEPEPPVARKKSRRAESEMMTVSGNNGAELETTQEEVVRAQQVLPDFYPAGLNGTHSPGRKMDIITIAGLAHWAEESTGRLGRERTEAVLTIAEKMGYLPPEIKQILSNLINIKPDGNGNKITVRHYLDALVKITTLLGKGNESEAALLSILFQEDNHR